jgi:hypothetical protein
MGYVLAHVNSESELQSSENRKGLECLASRLDAVDGQTWNRRKKVEDCIHRVGEKTSQKNTQA